MEEIQPKEFEKTGQYKSTKNSVYLPEQTKPLKRFRPNTHTDQPNIPEDEKENFSKEDRVLRSSENFEAEDWLKLYGSICESLLSKNLPDDIHFRDLEKTKIKNFLARYLTMTSKGLSTLIISGKPGGGKTLLLQNMLNRLNTEQWDFFNFLKNKKNNKQKQKKICILELNAMKYSSCYTLLEEVLDWIQKISGYQEFKFETNKNALYLLEGLKSHLPKILEKFCFVLLIDELDTLATHDRRDFDMIIGLLSINDSGFVKIGVSNTLDLFATYKGTKHYLDSKKLVFKPYKVIDLEGILRERVVQCLPRGFALKDLIEDKALKIISSKIYKNESGDIRAMLNVARFIFDSKMNHLRSLLNPEDKETEAKDKDEDQTAEDPEPAQKTPIDFKLSLTYATDILMKKYENKNLQVIKSMSKSLQVALFGLYFSITPNNQLVTLKEYKSHLKDVKQVLGLADKQYNIMDILGTLDSYGFVKLEKLKSFKAKSLSSNETVRSLHTRFELREYLTSIALFKRYILDQGDD